MLFCHWQFTKGNKYECVFGFTLAFVTIENSDLRTSSITKKSRIPVVFSHVKEIPILPQYNILLVMYETVLQY